MIGVYLHVPYCTVRCSYCDFYLVPARGRDLDAFVSSLIREIESAAAERPGLRADTLHFGGGTPSRLGAARLGRILGAARAAFAADDGAERALEANPEDVGDAEAVALRAAGFDRIALGIQSLDDRLLEVLRRPHDAATALRAIAAARRAGFRSVAADLILGLPGESPRRVPEEIGRIADAGIDHLSLYLLELHPRTRLGRAVALGRSAPPPSDDAAEAYEAAADRLESLGFEHYEISNFARPGHRSRHNLKYWTDGEYLGLGPSAHSYVGGERWSNPADLAEYLGREEGRPRRIADPQPPAVRGFEALAAGLRLDRGVDLGLLARRYGPGLPSAGDPILARLAEAGLLLVLADRIRLTRRGRLLSNEVLERLLPAATPSGPRLS